MDLDSIGTTDYGDSAAVAMADVAVADITDAGK
jgi:hypothetical protein